MFCIILLSLILLYLSCLFSDSCLFYFTILLSHSVCTPGYLTVVTAVVYYLVFCAFILCVCRNHRWFC